MTCSYISCILLRILMKITILPTNVDPQVRPNEFLFRDGARLRTLRWVGNRQSLAGPRGPKPDINCT